MTRPFIPDVEVRVTTFNNKGFPKMKRSKVNIGDYKVRDDIKPDILLEQERWFSDQLNGFAKIFSRAKGYRTYSPVGTAGTITAANIYKFQHLSRFNFRLHYAVPYVCAARKFTGEVCAVKRNNVQIGRSATYLSAHLTPSAFSSRFPDGSIRKRTAQREWHRGMRNLKSFVEKQIAGGRDYVFIGMDANAQAWRIREYFNGKIGGKPVQVFTSPSGYKIDHIIIIGNVEVLGDPWVTPGTPSDHDPFTVKVRLK